MVIIVSVGLITHRIRLLKGTYTYVPSYSQEPYVTGLNLDRVKQLRHLPGFLLVLIALHEDDLFFSHKGLNLPEIKRSLKDSLKTKKLKGGSSITQQLVRNIFVLARYRFLRKPLELLYAILAELVLTKEEIFVLYLDNLRFGYRTETGWLYAVEKYFNKQSKQLTLSEALFLCNLIPNPSIRSYFILRRGAVDKFPFTHIYGRLFDFIRFVVGKWGPLCLNDLSLITFDQAVEELKKYHLFRHDTFDQDMQRVIGIRVDLEMYKLRKTLEELVVQSSLNLIQDPLQEVVKDLS